MNVEKNINVFELEQILKEIKKSTVVSITYKVDDSRSKTVKGKKQVQKLVYISHVYLNHDYTQKVQRLSGDDNFVANELKGKTRVCGTLLKSDKTDELMIDGKVLVSETAKILAFYHNDFEISEQDAIDLDLWTPSYYKETEKSTMGRGIVPEEKDFNIINTYLNRIVKIKIQGTTYNII